MRVNTRLFGEIDIEDEKIIVLDQGIIGFPDLKKFTLIYDEERKTASDLLCGSSLWMSHSLLCQ